ncbi:polyprenyl synthetase family protein [Metabacillus malikii]|uniref:Competence protein ComQ n=1 Tax=Metabacillus malikii TaxID=1504265 RepID=A0ABT9ZET4_9BACI|nr:polyprenyl synthetase family protein [Metabacillus malikii]MDQ0229775.1 competence protein ComQ [Metabacillus malikii]
MIIELKHKEIVKQQMQQLITSHINNLEQKDLLLSFLNAKQHMNFGRLAIVHHQVFGGRDPEIFRLAAAIELLVLSFDMFDDLEDMDNFAEPWMKIDRAIALNTATTLYSLSQQSILSLTSENKQRILHLFLSSAIKAMDGQHEDLRNTATTEAEMLDVIKRKSGTLISLATVSGMLLANEFHPEVKEYSYHIGIAGQIDNDVRDLFNDEKRTKAIGRTTLATLFLQKGYNKHSEELVVFFNSGKTISDEFGSIKSYKQKLADAGVLQYLNVLKQVSINRAFKQIEKLDLDVPLRDKLKNQLFKTEN